MYSPRPISFPAHWCAGYSKYRSFLAGGISNASSPLLFWDRGSAAKTLISQYRQLRRLKVYVQEESVVAKLVCSVSVMWRSIDRLHSLMGRFSVLKYLVLEPHSPPNQCSIFTLCVVAHQRVVHVCLQKKNMHLHNANEYYLTRFMTFGSTCLRS